MLVQLEQIVYDVVEREIVSDCFIINATTFFFVYVVIETHVPRVQLAIVATTTDVSVMVMTVMMMTVMVMETKRMGDSECKDQLS